MFVRPAFSYTCNEPTILEKDSHLLDISIVGPSGIWIRTTWFSGRCIVLMYPENHENHSIMRLLRASCTCYTIPVTNLAIIYRFV